MFDDLYVNKSFNSEKALLFGFKKLDNHYSYKVDILDNLFLLEIIISSSGHLDTLLIDKDMKEEYILYKTNSNGEFVGRVRETIEDVVKLVVEDCYDVDVFKSLQTKEVIHYVLEKYGDELEFLWKRSPDNAIWRRKDTSKWYGVILTVEKYKLGLNSDEKVEILDLRIEPQEMRTLLKNNHYYPGWHMNKKHWYTIILDNSVSTNEICKRIDKSYLLAL